MIFSRLTLPIVLALASCSGTDGGGTVAACKGVSAEVVDAVAEGLTSDATGLDDARAVELPTARQAGPATALLAARIVGPSSRPIGVWAVGGLTILDVGPIDALNDVAQEFSQWGAAVRAPSPAARQRDAVTNLDELDTAVDCVEEAAQ